MKIATYNVRNLYDKGTFIDKEATDAVTEEFFNERINYFIEKFRKLDLDIICLQEIGGGLGVSKISEALNCNYFLAKPNSRGIRMGVMYKKELGDLKCESVSFGDLSIPVIQERGDTDNLKKISQCRDVLVCDLENYNGKKLRVVTFHLKSLLPMYLEGESWENVSDEAFADAKFRSVFYKIMELRAIRSFVNKSFVDGYELVLLGDFNEDRNASSLTILKDSIKEETFLYDVLTDYKGDDYTHMFRGNKLTFDTILISPNLKEKIKGVSVLNDELKQDYSILPFGEIEHIVEPDHAMVVVDLKN